MPADEGLGFDNHQGVSPGEESRPQDQRKTSGGGELAGWNSVFLVEGKLLAQEQYFGTQGSPGRKCQSQEMGALGDGSNKDKNQRSEQLHGLEHVHLGIDRLKSVAGSESLLQRSLGRLHFFMCIPTFCGAQLYGTFFVGATSSFWSEPKTRPK